MITLSAMVYLPKKIILAVGIILVAGHNLLDNVHVSGRGVDAFAWSLLHEPGSFVYAGKTFFVLYPIIPWVGTILLGYSLGNLYSKNWDVAKRKKALLWLGSGAILLFLLIRFINMYGDPVAWSKQPGFFYTVLSFIKVNKYPPSLLYLLMTIGTALIFLAFSERTPGRLGKIFIVFGRTAMFYYMLHIYLIHLLAMIATNFSGHKWTDMIFDSFSNTEKLNGYGFSLGIVYLVWITVILILYPLCKWYDGYKTSHKEKWWLSYL